MILFWKKKATFFSLLLQLYLFLIILQIYPKDTPLSLFTALLPEDLDLAVPEEDQSSELLRQRILRAVDTARQWVQLQEVTIFLFFEAIMRSKFKSSNDEGFSLGRNDFTIFVTLYIFVRC